MISNNEIEISNAIRNHQKITFNYDVFYNLEQLQNILLAQLKITNEGNFPIGNNNMIINFSGDAFGEYKIMGKGNQNQMSFVEKTFISDDKKKLNYLANMLNSTSAINALLMVNATKEKSAELIANEFKKIIVEVLNNDRETMSYLLDFNNQEKNRGADVLLEPSISFEDIYNIFLK